ncbi:acetyl esterase [Lachnospiraceae bacterium]|nr:acetyl esterase [Lachnospiraceae bacterium]
MRFDAEKFRKDCKENDTKRDTGLKTPDNIRRYDNISYGKYGKYNLLDIYHKKDVTAPQKTIIDIHGGGWTYGDKDIYQYYCMDLAQRGFTVVNFSYRLSPENPFPAALEDINTVFTWVAENADTYSIDLDKICVAGDSAGAQLASQYLTLLCSDDYRKLFAMQVPFDKITVKAVALNCGCYDMKSFIEKGEEDPFFIYIEKALSEDKERTLEQINVIKYINKDFPPTYLMTSEYDFLKEDAKPMYELLKQKGISCVYKLYGKEGDNYMGHVFHLNLRLEEARMCNDEECSFFERSLE